MTTVSEEHDASARRALWDAHTHVWWYRPGALDALTAHGVVGVRDCGGDLDELLALREAIRAGSRIGPQLFVSGPVLDGPKEDVRGRLTVRSPSEARAAVDMLAARGVDFIKTHDGIAREPYLAALDQAARHGLKVISHLPQGVAVSVGVDAGASSIEHAAESLIG